MVEKESIPFYSIHAGKMRRYVSIKNFFDLFVIPLGILESVIHLVRLRPDVIFSKGGYVSFHVVVAGWILRKKIIIHESDVVPGLTTRLSSHFASIICISWERTKRYFPTKHVELTGIPVREELRNGNKEKARLFCNLEQNALPTLLVIGGSLGAGNINTFIWTHLMPLTEAYNVVHIVGKGKSQPMNLKEYSSRYCQLEFVQEELPDILALSDVIISRAGSTFLAECAYIQKPLIMIPLPLTQSRGDQFDNAEEYMKLWPGRGLVILEEEMEIGELLLCIKQLSPTHLTDIHCLDDHDAVSRTIKLLCA